MQTAIRHSSLPCVQHQQDNGRRQNKTELRFPYMPQKARETNLISIDQLILGPDFRVIHRPTFRVAAHLPLVYNGQYRSTRS